MGRYGWYGLAGLLVAFSGQTAPLVRVATYADYAPLCFYAPGANPQQYQETLAPGESSQLFTGLAWDVVLRSFHHRGYRVQLNIVPWARALKMLDQGDVEAIFPAIKTKHRRQRYLFSQQQVYPSNPLLVYTQAQSSPLSLSDLPGKRIGVIRRFSYGQVWQDFIDRHVMTLVPLKGARQGFAMLEKGRIDGLVGYQFSHDYLLHSLNKQALFEKTPAFDLARSFLMGRPDTAAIMAEFNQGRQQLEQQGEYRRLLDRWQVACCGDDSDPVVDDSDANLNSQP